MNELEKAIEFVEINISFRRDELIPTAKGIWKMKYEDELELFEYIRIKLLGILLNRKPTEDEIKDFKYIKK